MTRSAQHPTQYLTLVIMLACTPSAVAQIVSSQDPLKVTADQLGHYLREIRAIPDVICRSSSEAYELLCSSESQNTIWVFTTPGHPAHPAVVRRTMTFDKGHVAIDRIGRYAGSKEAYEQWDLQFEELDQRELRSLGD